MTILVLTFCGLLAVALGRTIETDKMRVVNGEDAQLGERPFQVSMQLRDRHFCGGSVINENWVLTAAHCVQHDLASESTIVVGTISLQEPFSKHKVEKIIVHEYYSPNDFYRNDIALIKVATPFKFSDRVQPVALPEAHKNVKTNSSAVLSGWGYLLSWTAPDILQKVTIYVTDPEHCGKIMKDKNINIYPTQICANDMSMRKGQCSGDSGGPLTVDGKLEGIVSWSIKDPHCASTKFPGVYTRVSEYIEWIDNTIKAN